MGPIAQRAGTIMDRINDFTDIHVLPWPVRFLTRRFAMLLTTNVHVPLIVRADQTVLALGLNS